MNANDGKVRDLFDQLQPMDAVARANWFASHPIDSALRKRLQLMLAAADSGHGVLDDDAAQHVNDLIAAAPLNAPGPSWLGRQIGVYRMSISGRRFRRRTEDVRVLAPMSGCRG